MYVPARNNVCGAGEIVISPLKKVEVLYSSQTFVPSSLNLSVFCSMEK